MDGAGKNSTRDNAVINDAGGAIGDVMDGAILTQPINVVVTARINPIMRADADAEVAITVNAGIVAEPLRQSPNLETVRLESDSFKIKPSEPRVLDLTRGPAVAKYIISPTGPGEKLLRLFAQHTSGKEYEAILPVRVTKIEVTELGIDAKIWTGLQAAAAAIGFPSIILLIVTRRLDARKKKAEEEAKKDDGPKIILPK
ncbi:hypothetical protein CBA19CS11_29320 [Caballeronia novacaledonica]|uniref:hypothetical protein n=1 Tax=Caballeronia novacaledonica TaxID=1544861 RepID=UPI001EE344C8|nr:hypothetical protein [Caballeronia novacaledonica]GJH13024.1 hypothetical protein CBA19CS11_29320 [Caballeronia novacaledonica]